ncbi:MAG: hypothetical protein IJE08_03735 [Clostridia bacterium]|nr:hypothetical protein [Clostridia bacterium]
MAKIKGRVHYVSPKGCAEMVAEVIAREVGCPKEALLPAYLPVGTTLMFLGGEGTKMDKTTAEFLKSLDPSRVTYAALFSCNSKLSDAGLQQVKAGLEERGIKVLDKFFVCTGKAMFGGKMPSEEDLKNAKAWAIECIEKMAN